MCKITSTNLISSAGHYLHNTSRRGNSPLISESVDSKQLPQIQRVVLFVKLGITEAISHVEHIKNKYNTNTV